MGQPMRAVLTLIGLLLCANLVLAQTSVATEGTATPGAAADTKKKETAGKRQPSEKQLAQRAKMKRCNAEAGQRKLKGDERVRFMSGCLSNQPTDTKDAAAAR